MDVRRAVVCGSVSATGVALAVAPIGRLLSGEESALGIALAGLGAVVALTVAAAGALLYRSDVTTGNAARVAGWNLLGVVVLGLVLVLASLYVPYAVPTFLIADVLAVSAFAHVLIGYNDVRRIRAEEVAAKTEKLAVLNRVLRHNLRTEAQAISGYAELLVDGASDERTRGHAETVRSHADRLGRLNTSVKHVFGALDAAGDDREAVDAALAVETAVATVAEKHPDAELTADVTAGLSVAAGEGLEPALVHLIENGVRHNDADTPRVHVDARTEGDEVTFAVADDGPGIPEMERSVVVDDDDEITQLNHGQGLGLWVVKWTARAYGGAFDLDADDGGTTARLRLRRAA